MVPFPFMYSFSRAAITQHHKPLIKQKVTVLQFWRLEYQEQGIGEIASPPRTGSGIRFVPVLLSSGLLQTSGSLWPVSASP